MSTLKVVYVVLALCALFASSGAQPARAAKQITSECKTVWVCDQGMHCQWITICD